MKNTKEGIVLKRLNYSETSLIITFFTKENGIKTFLFQGAKKKKGNILHPLAIVEISSFSRSDSSLEKISSIERIVNTDKITTNPIKSSVSFFIAELLMLCLHDSDEDKRLYLFISDEVHYISGEKLSPSYLIWFMLKLSGFLGFQPNSTEETTPFLDLEEGVFIPYKPSNHKFVNDEGVKYLNKINQATKNEALSLTIPKSLKSLMLNTLLTYFEYHLPNFKTPKSYAIIKAVFE